MTTDAEDYLNDPENYPKNRFKRIVAENNLNLEHAEHLIRGFEKGLWSRDRVMRELNIDKQDFHYVASGFGISDMNPLPHYDREEEIKAVTTNESTLKRIVELIKQPARKTILVPLNHDVICELHALNRLDILSMENWETHLSKFSLLASTHILGFKESLKMMRTLPKNILIDDGFTKIFRIKHKEDERKIKSAIEVHSNFANQELVTRIQDDAELNVDAIYLTSYKGNGKWNSEIFKKNTTINSRNFMVNVESLIKLVDEK